MIPVEPGQAPVGEKDLSHVPPLFQPATGQPLPIGESSEPTTEIEADMHQRVETDSKQSDHPETLNQGHGRQQQKTHQKHKQKKKRHGARNQHRHKFFVKWLLETFDLEESRSRITIDPTATTSCGGTNATGPEQNAGESTGRSSSAFETDDRVVDEVRGVVVSEDEDENDNNTERPRQQMHILDVAGGKGEVSARLTMCHQQQVIMVDPRPADIVDCYERIVLPKIPNKWQKQLERKREANPNFVKDVVGARFRQLVTTFDEHKVVTKSACYSAKTTNPLVSPSSPPSTVPSEAKTPTDLQLAVRNATLIVGLHADGATEAIVDAALEYKKPFVVVPCCVFPNFFPMRRILVDDPEDGSSPKLVSVRTHEQFCTYLLRKDPRFVMEELPFEGRNIAIWWNGK